MSSFRSTLVRAACGALAGLLAAFTALAVAELVAGLMRPAAGPVTVVDGAVIDRTPAPVKDFAIRAFGENDKAVLQLGILAILALVALALGILALSHRRAGAVGVLLFGIVGAVAALSRPDSTRIGDVLPSAAGALVGAFALYLLAAKVVQVPAPADGGGEDREGGWDRRGFLTAAGVTAAGTTDRPMRHPCRRNLSKEQSMMNSMKIRRTAVAVAAAALLPLSLAACSDSDSETKAAPSSAAGDQAQTSATPTEDAMTGDQPFGPACAGVPKEGAGSFDGMAKDPVATAASNNPALSTLVTAVKQAGLVDTLNNAENITVFAPTNDAFAKIPKADLDKVLADKATLTKILTYHVVGEKLTPKQLENGSFETLQKGMITTKGSGENYTVNDVSKVVCGNVKTANANVYIVDTVLMPK